MKLLSRTEFADIQLFEEGEKWIVKTYRLQVGDEAHFLKLLGGIHTPKLYKSDAESVTMEYIEGAELGDFLGRVGPGDLDRRLELIRTIAYVYAFFHDNGVLHLDPKPDNILVRKDGTVKIIDFQLSTTIENPLVHLSRDGVPYYWYNARPPESFSREFRPTVRSEIYSLGHLFYFIIRGRFLCEDLTGSATAELTKEKLKDFHENIDRFEPAEDPLSRLVGAMVRKNERERPESMKKILHSLGGVVPGSAL